MQVERVDLLRELCSGSTWQRPFFLPMLACLGFNWEDMTSWQAVGNVLLQAVQSPVIVVSVLVSVWNLLNDPTTSGLSDSSQALSYTEPKQSSTG